MPRIVIDNTTPNFVFDDSSRPSDGVARAFANVARSRADVAQIHAQQQQAQMAEAWKQKEWDRQTGLDAQSLDHQQQQDAVSAMNQMFQGQDRQATQDYQQKRLGIDQQVADDNRNEAYRDDAGAFLQGVSEQIFGKPRAGGAAKINAGTGWHQDDSGKYFRTSADGMLEVYDPQTKQTERIDPNAAPAAAAPAAPSGPGLMQRLASMFGGGDTALPAQTGMQDGDAIQGQPALGTLLPGAQGDAARARAGAQAPAAQGAKGTVDQKTLQDYAKKHGMDAAAAADFLTRSGYTVAPQ